MKYLLNVGSAFSRLLNALTGGHGWQTFSARSWQLKEKNAVLGHVRVFLVDLIFGKGHCRDAYFFNERVAKPESR